MATNDSTRHGRPRGLARVMSKLPTTRAARRAAYKQQADTLRGRGPADSIRRIRLGLAPHPSRRPCDAGADGTWFPTFAINAITTVLKEVELAFRKTAPRQPCTPRSQRSAGRRRPRDEREHEHAQ